ncbi:DUF2125 domain-containing protein [uncultured Tateyamaria sp.]|uniref:DUF2125 domain-containing protein n=1 Tax=Tateyamaria sp. 1078 TaxID=3417464 RepID=UPI00260F7C74|nr:DUF2125 domain-containing protein [uncultured Tateyamaria sp.]
MRRLIWIFALALLAWCGWWWAASTGLQRGVDQWLSERADEGWQAEVSGISGGGFPTQLRAGLNNLALADPETGLALRTRALALSAPAWWPGNVTVTLDDAPIALASPYGVSELTMTDGVMAMELRPGGALTLEALGWTAGPWQVTDAQGVQAQAQDLTLTMAQTDGPAYAFVASAREFSPGDATRRGLRLPDGFPDAFDSLQLRADVTFDRPWDRRALNERRPQPRQITLHLAEARWGDLSLNLAADLTVDANGTPEGTVSLQAENWQTMLDIAQSTGTLPSNLRGQAEGILGAMARASGNDTTLDVDLTLKGGAVLIGFIPIAPAPRLILR